MTNLDKKEFAISAVKTLFSMIPYAGQAINEVLFEYRGRIKQNRMNHFTELLTEFFVSNAQTNLDLLRTEDFSDLLESVIIRVSKSKSQEKHRRFRDILINQIINPEQNLDNSEIYLELVSDLNESAINILHQYQIFAEEYKKITIQREYLEKLKSNYANEQLELNSTHLHGKQTNEPIFEKIKDIDKQLEELNTYILSIQDFKKGEFYGLSDDEFLYNKQILASKALLLDNSMSYWDIKPFQSMVITEFGSKFINFLIN